MHPFRYFVLSELRKHFPMNLPTRLLLIRMSAATLVKMEALYERHKNYQKNGIRVRPRCTKEECFFNRSR